MRISDWSSDVCSSDLLDQMDRASPDMRNSARMLDFLESPQASRAFQMVEGMSDSGGFADWMAGSVGRGGLTQKFGKPSRRSGEPTSELQSLMRSSYAGLCLKKKNNRQKPATQSTLMTPHI